MAVLYTVQLTDCAGLLAVESPLPTLWKPETIEQTKPQALGFHETAHIKLIELLREPYRIDLIAGRTDIQTGLQPRPGILLATST